MEHRTSNTDELEGAASLEPGRIFGSITDLDDLIGNDKEYSSTEIRNYLECPYKWFYTQRIRPKSIDNDFGPIARGNVLHGALELFYNRFTGAKDEIDSETQPEKLACELRVTSENLPLALEILEPCVDDYLATARKENLPARGQEEIVEDCRQALRTFIASETSFLPEFNPSAFEVKFGREADAATKYAGLWVKGKLDRVDRDTNNGFIVVTDYKSGSVEQYQAAAQREKFNPQVQVALYASVIETLTGERTVGSLYRSIRQAGEQGGAYDTSIFDDAASCGLDPRCAIGDYRNYLDSVEEYVATGMTRLLEGDIAPHPWIDDAENSPCWQCPISEFCPGATARGGAFKTREARNEIDHRAYLEAAAQALANPLDEASFVKLLVSPLFNVSDALLFKLRRMREEHHEFDSICKALGELSGADDEAQAIWERYQKSARVRRNGDLVGAIELLLSDRGEDELAVAKDPQVSHFLIELRKMQDDGDTPYVLAYKLRQQARQKNTQCCELSPRACQWNKIELLNFQILLLAATERFSA